jgi:hypothetical protein
MKVPLLRWSSLYFLFFRVEVLSLFGLCGALGFLPMPRSSDLAQTGVASLQGPQRYQGIWCKCKWSTTRWCTRTWDDARYDDPLVPQNLVLRANTNLGVMARRTISVIHLRTPHTPNKKRGKNQRKFGTTQQPATNPVIYLSRNRLNNF